MSAGRPIMLLSLAAAIMASLLAGSASAAPAAWMLNGRTLTEDGLTTAAVKTIAKTDKPGILTTAGLVFECTGNGEATSPTIHETDLSSASSLILTSCHLTSPAACSMPTTVGTVPLSLEGTLDGTSATKGIIKPTTGKVFTTLAISGSECAAAGNKPITGDFEMLSPEGQLERTDQLEEAKQGSTGLFKLGSESASLSGTVLVLLANSKSWSFL